MRKILLILTVLWVLSPQQLGFGDSTRTQVLRNWGLDNTFHSHVDARKAWGITRGSRTIVVAVIDTGIDAKHLDLKNNLWCKPKVTPCEFGWDFVKNSANPVDEHGHGTHVAGIIAGSDNQNGASGVAPNVRIMAVRYYSKTASGSENLSNTVKSINYAIDNGANIINYSGGGTQFNAIEKRAIQRAEARGILVVAAAGNESHNTDLPDNAYYPADYQLGNIVSVASTDINNQLVPSSNWGVKRVDVAAPGENIFSSLPSGKYGYLTGTSQATAFVTGIAALLLSENPYLSPAEVRQILIESVDPIPELKNKTVSGGRVNAYSALKKAKNFTKTNDWLTMVLGD